MGASTKQRPLCPFKVAECETDCMFFEESLTDLSTGGTCILRLAADAVCLVSSDMLTVMQDAMGTEDPEPVPEELKASLKAVAALKEDTDDQEQG